MVKPAWFLFLLFSTTAPPCEAARSLDRLAASTLEVTSEQDDESESQQKWGFYCPNGLRANRTAKKCYYDGVIDPEEDSMPDSRPICADGFKNSKSNLPLVFDDPANGGTFMFEEQFAGEMAVSMGNTQMLDTIGGDLVEIEMKRNATFAAQVHEFMHNVHKLGEDNKPVEFLIVHAGLHVALEVAVHGLEVLAHSAHAAAFFASAGLAETLAVTIPIVGLALFPVMAAFDTYTAYHHYKYKAHHAKNFAKRLVWKADCTIEKTAIHKADAEADNFLQPKVGEVCGKHTAAIMAQQIQRANVKLHMLMNSIAEMGRCLWPHGARSWSKTNCAEAVHMPLRSAGDSSGLLWLALSMAAAYGQTSDQLLVTPVYQSTFSNIFGVNMTHSLTLLHTLVTLSHKELPERTMGCMSLLALHRAFERIFDRMAVAIKVWSRTYSREITHRDIRILASTQPCKRVFKKLEATSSWQEATCKDQDFREGHGDAEHDISEEHPCVEEANMNFAEHFGNMLWPENEEDESHE